MTLIESVTLTDAYDAEIASQDDDDLLSDLAAIRANLRRRKLSSIPDIDRNTRTLFRRWIASIVNVLEARGIPVPPEPERKEAVYEPDAD